MNISPTVLNIPIFLYLLIHLNFILLLVWTASVLSFFYNRLFRNTWGNPITPLHGREQCQSSYQPLFLLALHLWHIQLQTWACPKLADAGTALGSHWEFLDQAVALQCWATGGSAQACGRANTQFGIIEGVSISSWQWQVPSVFPDVLGDGFTRLK